MTDLDNLKNILTQGGVVYEVNTYSEENEIDLIFQLQWMPEALIFTFDSAGNIKGIE